MPFLSKILRYKWFYAYDGRRRPASPVLVFFSGVLAERSIASASPWGQLAYLRSRASSRRLWWQDRKGSLRWSRSSGCCMAGNGVAEGEWVAAMALVGSSAGLACLGMSESSTPCRTAPFCGGPQKSARAATASELVCALSPGAIMKLPSCSQTGRPVEVARDYRDKPVLSKLATTAEVDLNAPPRSLPGD